MRVLFWNTHKNENINQTLCDLVAENNISIITQKALFFNNKLKFSRKPRRHFLTESKKEFVEGNSPPVTKMHRIGV